VTRWSLVSDARCGDPKVRKDALEKLCEDYWKPIFAYARRLGHSPADSEDLTQGFFSLLLNREDLGRIEKEKGKFRAYLRTAFRNYVSDFHRAASRIKRGGEFAFFSIDSDEGERRYREVVADSLGPEQVFDRHFAIALLDRAMARLRSIYEQAGKNAEFDALHLFLDAANQPSYAEVAGKLGLSDGAVKSVIYRFRGQFRAVVLQEVRDTLGPDTDPEVELRELFSAFP